MRWRDRLGLGRGEGAATPYSYPLERSSERTYAEDFRGDLFIWDIDKTYLVSEFDSFKGLLAIPFEFAVDKRNIAGTAALLRAIRRGHRDHDGLARSNPLYFVSGSPAQLRRVIERKMLYDGVEYDGITFKDHLAILRSRKVARVREQIGYKLSALLLNRRELPWSVREILFGDDSESDALIYGLYADIVAGRLRGEALHQTLLKNGVDPEDATYVTGLTANLPRGELVHRVYINLEKRSAPARFAAWSGRVVPCWDTFQMGLHLLQEQLIDAQSVVDLAQELANHFDRGPISLLRSVTDLAHRGLVRLSTLDAVWEPLRARGLLPSYLSLERAAVEAEPPPAAPAAASGEFVTPLEHLALDRA